MKRYFVFGLGKVGQDSMKLLLQKGHHITAGDDDVNSIHKLKTAYNNPKNPLINFLAPPYNVEKLSALFCHNTGNDASNDACDNTHDDTHDDTCDNANNTGFDTLILSPGVAFYPEAHPIVTWAQQHNIPITTDVDLLFEEYPYARYIGITGTNGKSTTTAFCCHMLKQAGLNVAMGGNIGDSGAYLASLAGADFYVLELSSYQTELLQSKMLLIAVLLNISKDHMEKHKNMANYIAAKSNIFKLLQMQDMQKGSIGQIEQIEGMEGMEKIKPYKPKATAIICADDEYTKSVYHKLSQTHQDATQDATLNNSNYSDNGNEDEEEEDNDNDNDGSSDGNGIVNCNIEIINAAQDNSPALTGLIASQARQNYSLRGKHNLQNLLACFHIGQKLGVTKAQFFDAIKTYRPLPHRMEFITEITLNRRKINFINDSKATNANATKYALQTFENIIWIAGGKEKQGGISCLAPYMQNIRQIYLIGESAASFHRQITEFAGNPHYAEKSQKTELITIAKNLKEALRQIFTNICNQPNMEARKNANASTKIKTGEGTKIEKDAGAGAKNLSDIAEFNLLFSPAAASFDAYKSFEERGEDFKNLITEIFLNN